MSLTLTESNKYSTTKLQKGVVDLFVKNDPILERLAFKTILGNSLTYDIESVEASAQWYNVNETWVESTSQVSQDTVTLKILGGAIDLDDFQKVTRSDHQDLRAELTLKKIKAVKKEFMDAFYYGNATTNTKQFNGLHALITSTTYNTVIIDANDGADDPLSLSLDLDKAIDMIKGFTPSIIVSSPTMRRAVTALLRAQGSINTGRDEFSRPIMSYNDIPWYKSDYIVDTETTSSGAFSAKTGSATTSIFVLSFDDLGLSGVHARPLEVVPWKLMDASNQERARIRWYCGLMMQSLLSCVKVVGIDVDGTHTV